MYPLLALLAVAADELPDRFHIPPAEPVTTLPVTHEGTAGRRPERWKARMVVDGTVTDAIWPEHPPTVYPLGKDCYLLDDRYSGAQDYLWNAATKKLTPVGNCYLHRAAGFGTIVLRRILPEMVSAELLDFPDGQPRVLLKTKTPHLAPLGKWGESLVMSVGESKLAVLEPGKAVRELTFDLGKFRWQPHGDAIRGDRVLLVGPGPGFVGIGNKEYTVAVAVLNLKTGAVKPVGEIPGGWTIDTNVPHPVYSAQWITQAEAEKQPRGKPFFRLLHGTSLVIEETEQIVK